MILTESKTYKVLQGWWVDKTGQLYWFKAVQNDEGLFYVKRRRANCSGQEEIDLLGQEEVVGWLTEEQLREAPLKVLVTKEIRR